MRYRTIPVIASLLLTTSAFAADNASLTPGKPAGVKKAQLGDLNPLVYGGVALAGVGIALAVSGGGSGPTAVAPVTPPVTTGTTG